MFAEGSFAARCLSGNPSNVCSTHSASERLSIPVANQQHIEAVLLGILQNLLDGGAHEQRHGLVCLGNAFFLHAPLQFASSALTSEALSAHAGKILRVGLVKAYRLLMNRRCRWRLASRLPCGVGVTMRRCFIKRNQCATNCVRLSPPIPTTPKTPSGTDTAMTIIRRMLNASGR